MTTGQLRIAILSIHSCPTGTLGTRDTGGMSVYIREMACELGKRGFYVDIFTRSHESQDDRVALGENVRLVHLKAGENTDTHKLVLYPYLPDFACDLENFRKKNEVRYDLIFSHYWLSGLTGKILQTWWHVPHVMMFHTLGAIKNALGVGEDEPELRIEAEKELAQTCNSIIAVTEREKAELIEYCGASPERTGVVPCGVNLGLFHPMDRKKTKTRLGLAGENVILYVGRIEPLKGIDRLIMAMSLLGTSKCRLLIIGGGEQSRREIERLTNLANGLGIGDSVTFLGVIEHTKLPSYYNAADVCVLPSYHESFGLTALEALACGTPVVATDVGALKDIIRQGETGYVIEDGNYRNMARKIDLVLAGEMHPAAIRDSVDFFDWSTIADVMDGKLRDTLSLKIDRR